MSIKTILSFFLLLTFLPFSTIAQNNLDTNDKSKSISIHITKGISLAKQTFSETHATSDFGIETQVSFHKWQKLGIQLKAGWMKWPDSRETYVPLLIGPEYLFSISDNVQLVVYGNAGPSFLVGNDYASVFGTAEIGVQLTSPHKQGIVLGVAWGQNTIFHPSHFSFIKGFAGWRF